MITANTLRYRIAVLKPVTVRDVFGAESVRYEFMRKVWADVKFKKGSRALEHGELWLPNTIEITTRLHKGLINEHVRLEWDGKTYQIDSINRDQFAGSLTIVATRVDEGTDPHQGGSGSGSGSGSGV